MWKSNGGSHGERTTSPRRSPEFTPCAERSNASLGQDLHLAVPAWGRRVESDAHMVLTNRLLLEPVAPDAVDAWLAVLRDAHVRRYLLDGAVVERSWALAEVSASSQRFASGSVGIFLATQRDGGALVGFAGFRPFRELGCGASRAGSAFASSCAARIGRVSAQENAPRAPTRSSAPYLRPQTVIKGAISGVTRPRDTLSTCCAISASVASPASTSRLPTCS
jgi:hypothetical protein